VNENGTKFPPTQIPEPLLTTPYSGFEASIREQHAEPNAGSGPEFPELV
jgi:hypothetical protein